MIETKHIIFFLGSALCVPAGIMLSLYSRWFLNFVFMAMVFGTCQPETLFGLPTDINFLSREWYRGSTRGIEVSYLDLLALILLFSSLAVRRRERRPMYWPPLLLCMLAFFFWALLDLAFISDPKIFGVFELTKVARGILLFLAVVAYVRSPKELYCFLYAVIAAVGYETWICLVHRYFYGLVRIRGTFPHPNSLSMYSLQTVPIFIAAIFSNGISTRLRAICIVAYTAAAGCVLLSISRTGFAVLVLLSGLSFALCTSFRLSPRNIGLALLGLLIGGLMVAKAWDSVMSRLGGFNFDQEYLSEEGDRGSYFRQATPIMNDYGLFGLGLNNWSYWVSNRYAAQTGYQMDHYPSLYAAPERKQQAPPAHNLYLLTAAELGWPGLLLLLALFARCLYLAARGLRSTASDWPGRLRIGVFLGLCAMMMQSWTEWEFRQTPMFFLGHISMGIMVVLYVHTRARRPV